MVTLAFATPALLGSRTVPPIVAEVSCAVRHAATAIANEQIQRSFFIFPPKWFCITKDDPCTFQGDYVILTIGCQLVFSTRIWRYPSTINSKTSSRLDRK